MTDVRIIPNEEEVPPPVEYLPRRNGTTPLRVRAEHRDEDAERAVLSAALTSADAVPAAVATGIVGEHFTGAGHADIWRAIIDVHGSGARPDPVTVADALNTNHAVGDHGFVLVELAAQPLAYTSNVAKYAAIVVRHATAARARTVLERASEAIRLGADPHGVLAKLAEALPAPTTAESMFTDLSAVADELDPPALCPRSDGACAFIYEARVHSLIGPSESGKSWVAALWCKQLIDAGRHVVVLDWEDSGVGWKSRLIDMGAERDKVQGPDALFHYAQRDDKWTPAARLELARSLETWKPALVVVDAMTPALATEGLDDWRGVDIAAFLADVVRLCRNAGAAVLIVDHVNKADETQTGSQYKRAGIDGVQYKLRTAVPMGRGKRGISSLSIGKDRHGFLRGIAVGDGDVIGTLIVDSATDGELAVTVDAPAGAVGTVGAGGESRHPKTMEALSHVIEAAPGGVTRSGAYEAVKGNRMRLSQAMAALLKEGWCTELSGPSRIVSVTPFRVVEAFDGSETDF